MRIKGFIATVLLVCSIVLIGVGYVFDLKSRPGPAPIDNDRVPYIEIAMKDDEVSLVGPVIEEWTKWETSALELNNYYRTFGDTYVPKSVVINWGIFNIPEGSFIQRQRFEISEDQSFQNAQSYDLRAGERSIELNNLLVDTQYFFRVTVELESSQDCIVEDRFCTTWSPRVLQCEGLENVRDIGGWKTADGKTVKQGLLYRGCELDGVSDEDYRIRDTGVDMMQKELKIKTELDLRYAGPENAKDMLGQDVNRKFFAFPSYEDFFSDTGVDQIKGAFEVLAEKENYPIYLHCTDGADRTGILCYVLEALLGMSAEDCYREWELSVFASGNGSYEAMDCFVEAFQELEGETLQNKAENYLLSIGITQDRIDSIKTILAK